MWLRGHGYSVIIIPWRSLSTQRLLSLAIVSLWPNTFWACYSLARDRRRTLCARLVVLASIQVVRNATCAAKVLPRSMVLRVGAPSTLFVRGKPLEQMALGEEACALAAEALHSILSQSRAARLALESPSVSAPRIMREAHFETYSKATLRTSRCYSGQISGFDCWLASQRQPAFAVLSCAQCEPVLLVFEDSTCARAIAAFVLHQGATITHRGCDVSFTLPADVKPRDVVARLGRSNGDLALMRPNALRLRTKSTWQARQWANKIRNALASAVTPPPAGEAKSLETQVPCSPQPSEPPPSPHTAQLCGAVEMLYRFSDRAFEAALQTADEALGDAWTDASVDAAADGCPCPHRRWI